LNTANGGAMLGDFDFCDQTPTTSAPYIDFLVGENYISLNITYCLYSCSSAIDEIASKESINVYPNPATDNITFDISNISEKINSFEIFDVTGKKVVDMPTIENSKITIEKNKLQSGIYYYKVSTNNKAYNGKFSIIE
jgi:hypothetical protein